MCYSIATMEPETQIGDKSTDALALRYIQLHTSDKPRLAPRELAMWAKVRPLVEPFNWSIGYDLDLGNGGQLPFMVSSEDSEMWKQLTVRRADVCLFKPGRIIVIELKPMGAGNLVGQLELDIQAHWETPLSDVRVEWIGVCELLDRHALNYSTDRRFSLYEITDRDGLFNLFSGRAAIVI